MADVSASFSIVKICFLLALFSQAKYFAFFVFVPVFLRHLSWSRLQTRLAACFVITAAETSTAFHLVVYLYRNCHLDNGYLFQEVVFALMKIKRMSALFSEQGYTATFVLSLEDAGADGKS